MTQEEYKTQTKELYNKILKVKTTPFTITYSWTNVSDYKEEVHMCNINGVKYIRSQDVDWYMAKIIPALILQNELSFNDILHVKVPTIGILIKVDSLLKIWKDIFVRITGGWEYKQKYLDALHELLVQDVTVVNNVFTEEEIKASEAAHTRRIELIKESRLMKKPQQKVEEKEAYINNETKNVNDTQRLLIAKGILCSIISSEGVQLDTEMERQVGVAFKYADLLLSESENKV